MLILNRKFDLFIILRYMIFAISMIIQFSVIAVSKSGSDEQIIKNLLQRHYQQDSGKNNFKAGWSLWPPYQFNTVTQSGIKLTGMDIELLNAIAKNIKWQINYSEMDWFLQQKELINGNLDIAAGATYDETRALNFYFSIPYRFEENSLFLLKNSNTSLSYSNIDEYFAQIRLQNLRIGITKGFISADSRINKFMHEPQNSDIIFKYQNDYQLLQALLNGEIDAFMADRIVGANIIIDQKLTNHIKEISLNLKTPIRFMFSNKTISPEMMESFNNAIKKFILTTEYQKIIKAYLYPVLLLQTVDSLWFYIIGFIGTVAFSISGICIGARKNATLFTTFLLAMVPSIGGSIMRDVILNREPVGIVLTPSYIYCVIILVLIGVSAIRVLSYYNTNASTHYTINKIFDNIIIICDSIGQASFITIGVAIVVVAKIEPLILWGPFFVLLTAHGGIILRSLLFPVDRAVISTFNELNAEISVFWGVVFSLFLESNIYQVNQYMTLFAVAITSVCAFLSRIAAHYYKLPNIKFY